MKDGKALARRSSAAVLVAVGGGLLLGSLVIGGCSNEGAAVPIELSARRAERQVIDVVSDQSDHAIRIVDGSYECDASRGPAGTIAVDAVAERFDGDQRDHLEGTASAAGWDVSHDEERVVLHRVVDGRAFVVVSPELGSPSVGPGGELYSWYMESAGCSAPG